MEEIVKIPDERIAVVIGTNGETKKSIEKKTKAKLTNYTLEAANLEMV